MKEYWKEFCVLYSRSVHVHVCLRAVTSVVSYSLPLWTPLSLGFSKQEYWSGLPCPPPGILLHPGIKTTSLTSPELAGGSFTTSDMWEAQSRSLLVINFMYSTVYIYLSRSPQNRGYLWKTFTFFCP